MSTTEYVKSDAVKFLEEKLGVDNQFDLKYELTCSKLVQQGEPDEHRWVTYYDNVYEVDGRFFTCVVTTHKSEMQSDSDIFYGNEIYESISEVFPHEVTTTIYK